MLFYFSGTGNSTFVATTLANFLQLELKFIPYTDASHINITGNKIVFVFPVYSWGVPPLVSDFIHHLGETFWDQVKSKGLSVDCVMTCGDEVALAPEMIQKDLNDFGVKLTSVRSVIMPNNYVLLPGFNIDSKEVESTKLKNCEGRIIEIAQLISRGAKGIDVTRGSIPWIKTKLVFPLFKRWGIFPARWHFNSNCISCGKCAGICPLYNITMEKQHPKWSNNCCSCLGCYHVCPTHAVEYGRETKKKGQYLFPLKKISLQNYHKR